MNIPIRKNDLVHAEMTPMSPDFRIISVTLAAGPYAGNRVTMARLAELDPFVRNGEAIAWVDEGVYSYTPRAFPFESN